ncbi:MAG: DUF86 domain-containing protein [Betaproteobacteria bacterium]|nr:DUF86 domain-containing protein [Betaproteobacteria bacterium]
MTIDEEVIRARLVRLTNHIGRIEKKRPTPLNLLLTDRDAQDIVSRNLEKAIRVCVDIASHVCAAHGRALETAGESFLVLTELGLMEKPLAEKLVSAVGFRNVSVHEYADVDWNVVMRIVANGLQDLKDFGLWASTLVTEPPPRGSHD